MFAIRFFIPQQQQQQQQENPRAGC